MLPICQIRIKMSLTKLTRNIYYIIVSHLFCRRSDVPKHISSAANLASVESSSQPTEHQRSKRSTDCCSDSDPLYTRCAGREAVIAYHLDT